MRSEQELEQLLTAYLEHINLPIFFIQSNILHISESKIDLLKKTGIQLRYLHIGYQTGSERTNRSVYNRYFNREVFVKKLKMLASKGIRVKLHVISDNPYEAFSDKYASLSFCHDLIKAVKPVSTIRQPIELYDHKLMFYPGSSLYSRAKADQVISGNYINDVLLKRNTLRTYKEDIDNNDAFVVGLFNIAMGNHRLSSISLIVFWLLKMRPLYYVLIQFNVLKTCNAIARLHVCQRILKED